MIYNASLVSEGRYEWFCAHCLKPLETTGTEYYRYVVRTDDIPVCWECEGSASDTEPELFRNYWEDDWFLVGKHWVDVLRFSPDTGMLVERVSLVPPSGPVEAGLNCENILPIDEGRLLVLLSHNSKSVIPNVQ